MLEAIPSRPGDFGGGKSFAESLDSIDNTAVSSPSVQLRALEHLLTGTI